jgi:hypothetical protein
MVRFTISMTALVVGLAACERSAGPSSSGADGGGITRGAPSSTRVGSCDRASSTGTCSEYDATYLARNEVLLTSSCGKLGGTFVYAECPNTSVVGACKLSTGEVRKFYGTGASAYEPDRARKECETSFRGSWQAR